MKIKAMEYNVFSGRNYLKCKETGIWNDESIIDLSLVSDVIKKQSPDFVGLCELHGKGGYYTNQIEEIAENAAFPYHFFSPVLSLDDGSTYGIGLISRHPIIKTETFIIPDAERTTDEYYEKRCVAKATIDVNNNKIDVFVSHFGLVNAERVNAVKLIKELVKNAENPCILMGDFNCRPDSVHIMELSSILKNTSCGVEKMTHPSDGETQQIDYIFVDDSFKVLSFDALDEKASDHKPYIAELEL